MFRKPLDDGMSMSHNLRENYNDLAGKVAQWGKGLAAKLKDLSMSLGGAHEYTQRERDKEIECVIILISKENCQVFFGHSTMPRFF